MAIINMSNLPRLFPVARSPLYGIVLRSPQSMVRWQEAASASIEAKHLNAILEYLDRLLGVKFAEVWKVQQAMDVWATDIYFRACFNESDHLEFMARALHGRITLHPVTRVHDEIRVECKPLET